MDGCMAGWMDEWILNDIDIVYKWMEGWMDAWMDGCMDGFIKLMKM